MTMLFESLQELQSSLFIKESTLKPEMNGQWW